MNTSFHLQVACAKKVRCGFVLPFVLAASLPIFHLDAQVLQGESSATALELNVSSTTGLGAGFSTSATSSATGIPVPTAQGTAPAPFNTSNGPSPYASAGTSATSSIPNPLGGAPLLSVTSQTLNLAATALENNAQSDVDGLAGVRNTLAGADGSVLNLGFGVITASASGVPLPSTVALGIAATAFSSTATVSGSGDGSSFSSGFSHSVTGFDVTIFGTSILPFLDSNLAIDLAAGALVDSTLDLSLLLSPTLPANIKDFSASGTIRVFNTGSSTDTTTSGMAAASALQVQFTDVVVQGTVFNGADQIATQTSVSGSLAAGEVAASEAVPEVSTIGLMLSAGIALLFLRRFAVR